ncbi:glycosyltransferase [Roseisolibacter sp. H3M3-2]|uniref:glycosyltransferase n=1 Tax=Roseisolibacter sp. H3M3-2 TaxID=3031323 RepID=UPI0023DAA455|nr:glycosyltransferase [Roseisolibacter sp. H3M3-2]MDF1502498.1 glycosyltransferase [Roseisolibacter sp. H3M3-2]
MTPPLVLLLLGLALVVVPWALYPAAVFALARLRGAPPPPAPAGEAPTVTCVLATRDDAQVVRERVADFLAQDYPAGRLDVVVAVDHTAAAALIPALAFADPRVTVVAGDAPGGKCPALNAAVRAARGELLVFSDARQRFAPDVARKLADALRADPRLGITSGRLLLPADRESSLFRLYSRYELNLRDAEARLHSAVGVSGSVYAMWRSLWADLPADLILDDVYVPMRLALAGRRVGFVPDAFAHETRRVAAAQEFRRKVRTLTGNYQLCAYLPGLLLPWRNPLWLEFVCHKLLRLLLPLAFLLVAAGAALEVGRRLPPAALAWAAAALLAGAAWLALGPDPVSRRLRGIALQLGSMQAAAAVAMYHGVRGRWDVWKA